MRSIIITIEKPYHHTYKWDESLIIYSPDASSSFVRVAGRILYGNGRGNQHWPKDIPPGRYRVTFEPIEEPSA